MTEFIVQHWLTLVLVLVTVVILIGGVIECSKITD